MCVWGGGGGGGEGGDGGSHAPPSLPSVVCLVLVTRFMTTLRVELTYSIKEWGHILQNIKQENGH